jgi:hypothetical protein
VDRSEELPFHVMAANFLKCSYRVGGNGSFRRDLAVRVLLHSCHCFLQGFYRLGSMAIFKRRGDFGDVLRRSLPHILIFVVQGTGESGDTWFGRRAEFSENIGSPFTDQPVRRIKHASHYRDRFSLIAPNLR